MRYPLVIPALAAGLLLAASSLALAGTMNINTNGSMGPLASGVPTVNGVHSGTPVTGAAGNITVGSAHAGGFGHAGGNRHR
jgi:hypothetical protein